MRTRFVIELANPSEGDLPVELVEAAYRASDAVHITLVMPSSMIREVDRLLDPVVQSVGPTESGIRYVDADDEMTVCTVLASASSAIAATVAFRLRCESLKVPTLDVPTGTARLHAATMKRITEPIGFVADSTVERVAAIG